MKIYSYISGYVCVCADGPFTERLINICMHREMPIWDIKKCGTERITFKTTINAFKQMRTPVRRTKSKVRITERKGLPFIIRKYRNRKFAILGITFFLVLMWYASNHIMGITVFGNQRIPTESILQHLEESGLTLGAKTSSVEPDIIRNRMMTAMEELAWIGINANGSRVYVEVIERVEKDEGIEKEGIPCNIVAAKDGEIEQMIIKEGQTVVKNGSGVREGDVLVSGIKDSNITGFTYVCSRGEVIARTRYSATKEYPLNYTEQSRTGNKKTRLTLTFMNHDIPLYIPGKEPYEEYSSTENIKEYRIPVDILPSLFITRKNYEELYSEKKTRTPAEALERGENELTDVLMKDIQDDIEVIDKSIKHTLNEHGAVEVTVELICRENIAKSVPIEIPGN